MPFFDSPNKRNYFVGKGRLSFQEEGESDFRPLGNCSVFEVEPSITKLEHESDMEGIGKVDFVAVSKQACSGRIVMDEVTAENLALKFGGTVTTNSDGSKSFGNMNRSSISGVLKMVGSSQIGNQVDFIGDVTFTPSGAFGAISKEFATIEVSCDVLSDEDGNFGIWTFRPPT